MSQELTKNELLSEEDIAGMREIAAMGSSMGVGGALLNKLLDDREALRLAVLDFLRRFDKMGGTIREGHSRGCGVWDRDECHCAIGERVHRLRVLVDFFPEPRGNQGAV